MGRVFVIKPPPDVSLIICVRFMTKLEQKRGHFRLLIGGKRLKFLF